MPPPKPRDEPTNSKTPHYINEPRAKEIDLVLRDLENRGWNCLGSFIKDVLALPDPKKGECREQHHIQKVVAFLGPTVNKQSLVKADEIAEIMYSHRYSSPKAARNSKNRPATEAKRPDKAKMAQGLLEEWAVKKVVSVVSAEADSASSKDSGFHLRDRFATWDSIIHFSMTGILAVIESRAPVMLHLLLSIAYPRKTRPKPHLQLPHANVPEPAHDGAMPMDIDIETTQTSPTGQPSAASTSDATPPPLTYATHFSKPAPSGTGQNRRDPFVILLIAFITVYAADERTEPS